MARNLLHTAKAVKLISLIKEVEHFCATLEQTDLSLNRLAAEEIALRMRDIVHEADTVALPKRLIPAARAIGDAAYLLDQLISERLTASDDLIVTFDATDYQRTVDYTQKALEALKLPALYYGADVGALETSGGLYL